MTKPAGDLTFTVSDTGLGIPQDVEKNLFTRPGDPASNFTLPPPDRSICFYLELTGPLNRIIVEHAAPRLTVRGGRRLPSLAELPGVPAAAAAAALGAVAAAASTFPLRSPEDIAATFARMKPLEQECYVVVDTII